MMNIGMRAYEKDTELKIPNWYFKLSYRTLSRISDFGIVLSSKLSRKKINRTNKRNINFNL